MAEGHTNPSTLTGVIHKFYNYNPKCAPNSGEQSQHFLVNLHIHVLPISCLFLLHFWSIPSLFIPLKTSQKIKFM